MLADCLIGAVNHNRQLALPFTHRGSYDGNDFMPATANADALAWLQSPLRWPNLRLSIYGPEGCGKTHLLHVFAARHDAALLSGECVRQLINIPEHGGLAIDDADAAPEPEALLHLLNAAAEAHRPVLLAGRTAPAHWPVTLPDLASRLRAVVSVGLGQPDDELLRALLARLLAQRQLLVEQDIQDYLLARLPRHGAALREAAACLDRLSLAAGRAATRATAAEVLARLGTGDDPTPDGEPASQQPPKLL